MCIRDSTQGAPSFDDKVLGREKTLADKGPDPEKEDRVMPVSYTHLDVYKRQ